MYLFSIVLYPIISSVSTVFARVLLGCVFSKCRYKIDTRYVHVIHVKMETAQCIDTKHQVFIKIFYRKHLHTKSFNDGEKIPQKSK